MKRSMNSHRKCKRCAVLAQARPQYVCGGVSFRDALATRRAAVAQARGSKRRRASADCPRACIHSSTKAWKYRTSLRTRSARVFFSHTVARLCGPSASVSTRRTRRPEREPQGGSAVLVWMDAQGRARCHEVQRRALYQRQGDPLMPVAVCPSVHGTLGIQRCQAHRGRGTGAGVSPCFLAFFLALLRRSCPRISGTRQAISRAPT
jgi:hypothetical protein